MEVSSEKYSRILNPIRGLAVGLLSGLFITLFANTIHYMGVLNRKYEYLYLFLPFGAIVTYLAYKKLGYKYKKTTVNAIDKIHVQEARKEKNLASIQSVENVNPLTGVAGYIFSAISHLFGASVGKEGVGVQIGLSAGAFLDEAENKVSKLLKIKDSDSTAYYMMSGAAAAFGSLFGSPIAGILFGLQFASPDIIRLDAILPCTLASISATLVTSYLGTHIMVIPASIPLAFSVSNLIIVIFFASIVGFFVRFFCIAIERCKSIGERRQGKIKPIAAVAIPSCIAIAIIALNHFLTGSYSYNGLSTDLMYSAISGTIPLYAFLLKALLILLAVLSGFIGGEVVPLLVTGATFGYTFASIFSLETSPFAVLGALSMLSGGTNLPIVCFLLGLELFKYQEPWLLFVACTLSYVASGKRGIYDHQRNKLN